MLKRECALIEKPKTNSDLTLLGPRLARKISINWWFLFQVIKRPIYMAIFSFTMNEEETDASTSPE